MASDGSEIQEAHGSGRAEIDSSPFDSVKEAANRFGGMGFWKPISQEPSEIATAMEGDCEMADVAKLEEETAELRRLLVVKERETLKVLKELEATKNTVEVLKAKLQKQGDSQINNVVSVEELPEKGMSAGDNPAPPPSDAPESVLLELQQAKLNLVKTTDDLAGIRATADAYKKKIEKERLSLEKARQRLASSVAKASDLEEELNQTKLKLEQVKDGKDVEGVASEPSCITRELMELTSEAEQFKKVGEAARYEVEKAISDIEHTKSRIRMAEIRLVAAKKMKEAARASEAVALAEIKAISGMEKKKSENVSLSFDEYSSLVAKASKAEQAMKDRVKEAMQEVNKAHISKGEILRKFAEAKDEVKMSKKSLEDVLTRVEEANKGKLAVEEALRKWRSEHGDKRRSFHSASKFKTPHPSAHRRDTILSDPNPVVYDQPKPILKPTLSIGQILSRKLLLTEEYENMIKSEEHTGEHKVSLARMLSRHDKSSAENSGEIKQLPLKRKKFGFSRITLLITKQSKKKKKKQCAPILYRNT